MKERKEYYAFISYKREDEKWAKWLQDKLEDYKFPTNLNGRTDLPKKIRPTFRDVTDLNPGLLAEEINNALRNSQWLIVVCSPRSAKSPWVCKEAQTFIDLGRADHIIPFVIEGNPFSDDISTECYPEALLNLTGSKELLAANINEMGRDAAAIKVVARMFNLRFDALWQRHQRIKRRKRILTVILSLLFLCLGVGVYSYVTYQKSIACKAQMEKSIQMSYAEYFKCDKLFNEHKYAVSFKECQRVMRSDLMIPDTLSSKFEYLLRMSYAAIQSDTLDISNKYVAEFPAMDWGEMPVVFSDDGDTVYVGCSGFTIFDATTGKCINRSDFWPSDIRVAGDRIYTYDDFDISIYNKHTLEKLYSKKLTTGYEDYQMKVGSSADGKRILTRSNSDAYNIYDTNTGSLINSFQLSASMASINHDGSIIALSVDEKLRLYKVETGEPINDYDDLYAADLQFDMSGKWLLLYLKKYDGLNILNLDTKENYFIENLYGQWGNSFNFDGSAYANKYIVSDDDRYIAIGSIIFDMPERSIFKKLHEPKKAMGLKIFPDARKVIQVNWDKEIIEYTRKGEPMFKTKNVDFSDVISNDKTSEKYDIETDGYGTISVKNKNGNLLGVISGVDGEIYHLSISPDEKYILVNSLAIPSSLYDLSTGTVVQQYPFRPGYDGDTGFGVIGEDGDIYFKGLDTVFQYHLIPLDVLLNINIDN